MRNYMLTHLSDAVLLRDLAALVAQDRVTTATLLAHIAEVDARRLFRPAGYPSMHAYCVDELRLSEDAASKRIQAARACRQFPVLLTALSEGQLHLAAICLLAPHLRPENVNELIEATTHKRKYEVEELLARRYPLIEMTQRIRPIPAMTYEQEHAPGHVESMVSDPGLAFDERARGHSENTSETTPVERTPPTTERYFLQLAIAKSTHEKLRHAQALLSHAVPTGDLAQVLDRALDALVLQLEKQKLGVQHGPAPPPLHPPQQTPRSGGSPTRRLGEGRGSMHFRKREGQSLQGEQISRIRPCRSRGEGRKGDRGSHSAPMPRAQPIRGRARVRGRPHEPEAPRGAMRGRGSSDAGSCQGAGCQSAGPGGVGRLTQPRMPSR